ncbi:ATP-grasp domain-containing protein [Adlercreutzia agrestimuris]|uniref:ATP-grasp domain-containing protein n=1 Tax=Adlercreutzia agrestimuris TaxID=2941324 RepID=UPI00203CB8E4|nr:ATP-grasp domain-containing protein [Adlercreutzia agrestimuris]
MNGWPLFVKPLSEKHFDDRVVTCIADLNGCGFNKENLPVFCSEPVNFQAGWRCFVRYGKILDVRPYRGDWRCHYDPRIIESALAAYTEAPAGYGADFGVTADGRTLLVEINDGYALGSYGLQQNLYAQLLCTRWSRLMNTPDELAYLNANTNI